MNKTLVTIAVLLPALQGCVSTPEAEPMKHEEVSAVTYDYTINNTEKSTLWMRARGHFATVYGDSRSVIRLEDEDEGLIIGKGAVNWNIYGGALNLTCSSEYNIRFMAKDNKARLQLELINGVPTYSRCNGWPLPSRYGYNQILSSYKDLSMGLESALNGKGKIEAFSDF
ncbi:DUF4468 domain-containing protein [Vibrio sp. FJH11]